jgi:hypothetical protein
MTSTNSFWEILEDFFKQIFGYPYDEWETDEIPRINNRKENGNLDISVQLQSPTIDDSNDSNDINNIDAPVSMRMRRSVSFESAIETQRR